MGYIYIEDLDIIQKTLLKKNNKNINIIFIILIFILWLFYFKLIFI